MKEQLRKIELHENFLKDDSSLLEEIALIHIYANSVTEETEIEH